MPMTCLYLPANLYLGVVPSVPSGRKVHTSLVVPMVTPYDAKNRAVKALAAVNRIDQHLQAGIHGYMATF